MSRRVIIIGASIAAMLTAKAISNRVDEVLLLERDALPEHPQTRTGVAQSHHAHILLNRGLQEIEQLFPGFTQQILAAGGVMTCATQDWYSLFPMGVLPTFASDLNFICASRPLIEHCMRVALLATCRNVRIEQHTKVMTAQLGVNQPPSIRVQNLVQGSHQLQADLLIDASGRNSQSPNWLQQAGFAVTKQITVQPDLGYATRIYHGLHLPESVRAAVVMAKDPDMKRGGVLFPIEGNRYICTLYGFNHDYPASTDIGFMSFAQSLRSDIIYQAIKYATPESGAKAFIKRESHYSCYAEKGNWPQGYLVIGDAVCSFNPIYGQGMTAAAIAVASMVQQMKKRDLLHVDYARVAQRHIVRAYRAPWQISTNEDTRWPGTGGVKRGLGMRMLHRVTDRIAVAATNDPALAYRYIKVLHMTASPLSLLTPNFIASVFIRRV